MLIRETFEASSTFAVQCSSLRKGGFVMVRSAWHLQFFTDFSHYFPQSLLFLLYGISCCCRSRPCRIVDMITSKTGVFDNCVDINNNDSEDMITILKSRKTWARQGSSCCPRHLHWQEGVLNSACTHLRCICFPCLLLINFNFNF